MLWSLRDPLDICQEVLQCHVRGGAQGEPFEIVEVELMAVCAHGASPRRLCFLRGGAKHTKCSQRGWILAAHLFGIGAGDQGALLQQAIPCLSLLSGFSGSKITLK